MRRTILALAALAALALHLFPVQVTRPLDAASIAHRAGHAFTARAGHILPTGIWAFLLDARSDSSPSPTASQLRLTEQGAALGPSHSMHSDIETRGGGRFSHWGDGIIFAASDNTSPLTNGRVYAVTYSVGPPWWIVLLLLVGSAAGLAHRGSRAAAIAPSIAFAIGCAAVVVYCNWAFRTLLAAPVVAPDSFGYLIWSIFRTWGYPLVLHGYHLVFGTWALLPLFQLNLLLASLLLLAYAVARTSGSYLAGWSVLCIAVTAGTMLVSAADLLTEAAFSAFATAHLAFMTLYFRDPRRTWALAAAAVLVVAILVKSVAMVLIGPLVVFVLFAPRLRRGLAIFVLVPATLAWLVPSAYNLARHGTFESSHAGGLALAGHVAWAIQPRPGSQFPVEAAMVAEAVAEPLAKRPARFGSVWEYVNYTANEYNTLLWVRMMPPLRAHYERLRPPEPCTWWGPNVGCISQNTLSINRTLLQLSKEAIAAEPLRYLNHVAVHDLGLWRDAFAPPNDFLLELNHRAETLADVYDPAKNAYRQTLAPLPDFKTAAQRWPSVKAFQESAARRFLDLATLRPVAERLLPAIHAYSPLLAALALAASMLVFRFSSLPPAAVALCYAALSVNAYFLGSALAQPAIQRYAATMQGALAALVVLAACVAIGGVARWARYRRLRSREGNR